jgi:hypothetical protein
VHYFVIFEKSEKIYNWKTIEVTEPFKIINTVSEERFQ